MANYLSSGPVELLLGRLDGVRRSGDGWSAPCPVPRCSYRLSIGVGRDGRALLYCPAGCDARAITTALGLAIADLFASPRRRGGGAHDLPG